MWSDTYLPASADPAAAMLTIIDAALVAEGWTFIETVTAANAGTTGDVNVYDSPDDDWVLCIEKNTTTALRFRVAKERQGTGATFRLNRFITAASTTSDAGVQTDNFATNTASTIVTCAYVAIGFNLAGTKYQLGIREADKDLFYLGTVALGSSYSVLTGFFEPLFPGDDTYNLFMTTGADGSQWTNPVTNGGTSTKTTNEVNQGTSSMRGPCNYAWCSPWLIIPNGSSADHMGGFNTSNRHFTGLIYAGKAYLVGVNFTSTSTYRIGPMGAGGQAGRGRGWRGKLDGLYVVHNAASVAMASLTITEPVSVDGRDMYIAGWSISQNFTGYGTMMLIDPDEMFA